MTTDKLIISQLRKTCSNKTMYIICSFLKINYMFYLILSSESSEKIIITANLLVMKLWFQLVRAA